MIRILATALLALCLTASGAFATSIDELVIVDGLWYERFTDVPFTGEVDEGRHRGTIKNGTRVGPWVAYYVDGRLWYKGAYKSGKQEGPWVAYWENGRLRYKGTYKNDRKEGPWLWYNEDGTKSSPTATYRNGEKVSD
jgi:antitoxin component YwqK of YwqJK toxin-antitoxin module